MVCATDPAKLPIKKTKDPDGFIAEFFQIFKEKNIIKEKNNTDSS